MKNEQTSRDLLRPEAALTDRPDLTASGRTTRKAAGNSLPNGVLRPFGHATPWTRAVRSGSRAAPDAGDGRVAQGALSPAGGQVLRGSFASRLGMRHWRLYVPTGATPGASLPLVVMLHGCTQSAEDFARGTRMDTVAEAANAFVLYPEQSSRVNPKRCWNWFKHTHQRSGSGEPAIIAGMIAQVGAAHPIDTARVFAAGLSAGGAMAAILGDCAPDLFAGVGVHSGLGAGSARRMPSAFAAMRGQGAPVRAPRVPMIVVHGDADQTVSPTNADALVAAAVRDVDGAMCSTTTMRANGRDCERTVWREADGRTLCERWEIHGAGHAWSGGDASGSYTDSSGPDASALMMDFFDACVVSHVIRPARAA